MGTSRLPWAPQDGQETPETVAMSRRRWLKNLAIGSALAAGGYGYYAYQGGDDEVIRAGLRTRVPETVTQALRSATRDPQFTVDRGTTLEAQAARYTNFYEFSSTKACWRYVGNFQPDPWTIVVDGLCRQPLRLDLADLHRRFAAQVTERLYHHRCVETWAMVIPWVGIPLAEILRVADPLPSATHVRFVSLDRPSEASRQSLRNFPWPYTEGLTLPEALNRLTFLATGMYGRPLLKQHGAPVRLVVPWKYGYKSCKSISRIEFVAAEPSTFWTQIQPAEYPFQSNVNPDVPHPRWSQAREWMLGTGQTRATRLYNGYAEEVASLYR